MLSEKPASRIWPLLAWAGAVAATLVSFSHDWTVPMLGLDLRTWKGHVLKEAIEMTQCVVVGGFLAGWWWRVVTEGRRIGSLALIVWSVIGFSGMLSREIFWAGFALWLSWGIIGTLRGVSAWRASVARSETVSAPCWPSRRWPPRVLAGWAGTRRGPATTSGAKRSPGSLGSAVRSPDSTA